MILYGREKWKKSDSAVYYPIKNVEIVNIVLGLIYPLSEWGICLLSRAVDALLTKNTLVR